ncbi:MAG: response regulator [Bacteroidales bacterium]|nr:response regulator [Bacteroidales bacterium]
MKIETKILIVDDISSNIEYLEALLEDLDITILTALSGYEGIEIVKQNELALIILDVQMPGIDGFQTLEKIRQMPGNENLPAIFVSGIYSEDRFKIKGLESGAVDFISKPVNGDILIGKVKVFIKLFYQKKGLDNLVSELKNTNLKLRESEDRFKKISTAAADAIIVLDNNGVIIYWNNAAEKIFGYTENEAAAINFRLLFSEQQDHADGPFDLKHFFDTKSGTNVGNTVELVAVNKQGIKFPVELSFSPFLVENNLNAACIIRDISKRKKIEQELLKTKELKEANKVMREFIDNLNHEIRTPLNGILGISGSLVKHEKGNLTDKHFEAIQHIYTSADRLNVLIERLFEFRSSSEVKISDFSSNDFIDEVYNHALKILNNKDVKFEIRKEDTLPANFKTDKEKYFEILVNIIENSIKFTNKGTILIRFFASDNLIVCKIADTGIGISESDLKNIFDQFVQIDGTSSRKYGGTGLGLALANKLIKMLYGNIIVESELSKGTTVTVKLPV